MKRFYVSLLLMLIPIFGFAQINKLRYGDRMYDKYDYIDAQEVYKKVIDKGYASVQIYQDLADSYYFQSDYAEAAQWYDKLFRVYPDSLSQTHYLRAIQSNKGLENYDKATQLLEDYKAKYGLTGIAKQFDTDPDYLASLGKDSELYSIVPVDVNREGASDHGPAFLGEDKIVFASASMTSGKKHAWDGQAFLDLYIADRDIETGVLSNAEAISGDVNTPLHESTAVFTKDGKTMYFTRNNVLKKKRSSDPNAALRLKIFKAQLQENGNWKVVEDLPFNSDNFSTAYPALNADETKLYFSSDRRGGLGMSDIWYVELTENGYGKPMHLGEDINTVGREAFLYISPEDVLYFSSDGHTGLGGLDIFYTQLDEEGMPEEIKNIGAPFNSPLDDFGFIIDPKQRLGYFSSNRGGENSADDDIYYFYSDCEILLAGQVRDVATKELLPGSLVELFDAKNNKVAEQIVGEDASYSFEVDCAMEYLVKASKDQYLPEEHILETPSRSGNITQDIYLKLDDPCPANDLGCRLALQPIYFDFDKHNIRPDAEIEISKVLAAMEMYPQIDIHIESHTDSRGTHAYNEALSDRRAKSTREWLINNGISADRLTAKGYGETQLVNECADGVPCTVEQHQLNRRSMFIITSPDVILKKK